MTMATKNTSADHVQINMEPLSSTWLHHDQYPETKVNCDSHAAFLKLRKSNSLKMLQEFNVRKL